MKIEEKTSLKELIAISGLSSAEKQKILRDAFSDIEDLSKDWDAKARTIVVTETDQFEEMKQARELRLQLRAKRIEVEKKRKEMKADVLAEGRAIDSIAKYLTDLITPSEKYLDEQEHYAENKLKAEADERARKAEELLRKQEAEEAAERERKEREKREEQEREIAKLKAEREEREKEIAAEREEQERKLAEERKAREEERIQREAEEEKRREAERKERAAREERERAELERRRAQEAKQKAEAEAERLRIEHTVSCPNCGHKFDTREEYGLYIEGKE